MNKKRKFSPGSAFLNAPYFAWAALFIVIPLAVVLFYAFTDGDGHFTFDNILTLKDYGGVILRSLLYSVIATAVTFLIAYPFSYVVCRMRPSSQKIANMFVTLPMWINLLIKTYCLSALMDGNGLINQALLAIGFGKLPLMNNTGAVIFGMVYNYLPYMILPIYNVMSKIEPSLLEAASDLGCGALSRVRRVIFPLTVPGIVSGIIMVFVPSVSTFYISAKMGGTGDFMIGDLIEGQIHSQNNNLPVAAALSAVLMAIILVSMLILNRFTENDEGGSVLI
ncbi:MAG: ABC transporter permease [Clostridia bacterium]|nr:ABC transporter permease [Clostridia bacterium]MBR3416252.1 ABC transporter permease [Clostridia bacterium]